MARITINVELEDYDYTTGRWNKQTTILHHDCQPFSQGGMRNAYQAYDCSKRNWQSSPMVLKMPIDSRGNKEDDVRTNVIMQAKCIMYANEFNRHPCVVKKIRYVPCRLVKFLSGPYQGQYGTLEEYMRGDYVKHNVVHPEADGTALTERNTPQAFSHFTFQKSKRTEIVVDVQGVDDTYTDPQLYSIVPGSHSTHYGDADWGTRGIANFFRRHRCNPICQGLGLDPIKPTDSYAGSGSDNRPTQPRRY